MQALRLDRGSAWLSTSHRGHLWMYYGLLGTGWLFCSGTSVAADAGVGGERRSPLPLLSLPKQYRDRGEPASFTLQPAKDGSKDLIAETPTFVARIAPDGGVRLEGQQIGRAHV